MSNGARPLIPETANGEGRPTHATKVSIFAIVAAIVSAASIVAMFAIEISMQSRYQAGDLSQHSAFFEAGNTAFWLLFIVAPVAFLLSIVAMFVRSRYPRPKPKLPILALTLSLVPFGFLVFIVVALRP